ncbi:putative shikimate kinase [Candidatus Zinderia insecticola CARI]|uniref:Shikimate kinase n=1 Tax=Zinderia insecticola (strain CARI) TaxID=871271 RepID=E0TIZ9_ZINIC|nr:putative shikimate kinase [Candidatus Zinderia insecticola CARI]
MFQKFPKYLNNIYLLGFSGVGKTTISKILSKKIKKKFYDIDNEIEKYINMKISKFIFKKGEKIFRILENKILKKIIIKKNIILSTGGGTLILNYNRNLLRNTGLNIYLELNFINNISRLNNNIINRPLIKNIFSNFSKLYILYKKRINIYKKIYHIKININYLNKNDILNYILFIFKIYFNL